MNEVQSADLFRYDGERNFLRGYWKWPGFRYTYWLRIAQSSKGLIWVLAKLRLRRMMHRYGYEFSEKCTIGPGLAIMHLGGIAVNHRAVIGKNCTIYHGVTIGGDLGRRLGAPKIGDMVWIGAKATIVGAVTVGSRVLVAPNSYVNFDVPDDSLVIGNPGTIKKFTRIDEYIAFTKEPN